MGDLVAYKHMRKDKKRLYPYILDYILLNGGMHVASSWLSQISFRKLDDNERVDWAFDVVSLFILGDIERVDYEITDYVRDYLECYESLMPEDITIRDRFVQYMLFIGAEADIDFCRANVNKEKNAFEKIYEVAGVDKKINDRIGEKDGKNTGS